MGRLTRAINACRTSRFLSAFNLLFGGMAVLYRISLAIGVLAAEAAPFGAEKSFKTFLLIMTTLGSDIVILIQINLVFLTGYALFDPKPTTDPTRKKRKNWYVLGGFLFLVLWHTLISGSHFNLLFNMNSGFTWNLFMEFFAILGFKDFITLLGIRDLATILLPITVFLLLWRSYVWRPRKKHLIALALTAFALLALSPFLGSAKVPDEIKMNPHAFFIRDAFRTLFAKSEATKTHKNTRRVFLDDKLFVTQKPDNSESASGSREYANVVVIVLESTSSEYIFDTSKYAEGKMPMPYLHSLAAKGLYMKQHFASNNSSPRSIFSIFSGLYESPQRAFFSMEKQLKLPHLIDFLGKKYDSFLVTPADINWYFPKFWFKNRGFAQIYDYHAMKNVPEYKAGPTSVRDEFRSADFFLNLAAMTKKPFLGIYYTFLGHWPYANVATEHQIIPGNSDRSRYINNLHAQDLIIKQIIAGFKKSGKFENTIFVIVGDHGEAFYQHPGNRVHSGESYNENIAAPLIIYSPQYISAQHIDYPTVHADIVPTILETLNIPYRINQFQGESLLNPPVRRYVFTYGNENTVTAVSADLKKMQIMRKYEGGCRHFDLKRDPAELHSSDCPTGSDHYRAIEAFFRVQPGILKGYNELCNASGC